MVTHLPPKPFLLALLRKGNGKTLTRRRVEVSRTWEAFEPVLKFCWFFVLFFVFFFFFFCLLGLRWQHMEVPRLRDRIRAVATGLHHSSQKRQILNPLSEVRDQTCILMMLVRFVNHWATTGTPCFEDIHSHLDAFNSKSFSPSILVSVLRPN